MSELRGLVRRRHVDRIVSLTGPPDPFYGDQYPSPSQLAELGRVATVDDVAVAPACGASPFG